MFDLTALNKDDNSHSSGVCFHILTCRCDINFNKFFLFFFAFSGSGGTFKVTDVPKHMKTSFVLLSTEGIPPDASPEKPVVLTGGKLASATQLDAPSDWTQGVTGSIPAESATFFRGD